MSIDKDLKQEIRIETGRRFGMATPTAAEGRDAARQVLESKVKQKRLQLDSNVKEGLINDICDDLLGLCGCPVNLGNAFLQKGNAGEALAPFQEALEIKRADPSI